MLTVKQAWASTGSSGGLTALEIPDPHQFTNFHIAHSTLATTNSVSLQTAQQSSGPWFIEGSTQLSTAVSTAFVMRISGPVGPWVRPYIHTASTGQYDFMLIGIN